MTQKNLVQNFVALKGVAQKFKQNVYHYGASHQYFKNLNKDFQYLKKINKIFDFLIETYMIYVQLGIYCTLLIIKCSFLKDYAQRWYAKDKK